MTEANEKLIDEFETYEKSRGIKALRRIRPHLKPFFSFLELKGFPANELKSSDAQDFQTQLATLEEKSGEPHYAALTVKSFISMATRFYGFLKAKGRVFANPFLSIKRLKTARKLPRNIPPENTFTAILEDLSRFWEHAGVTERRMYYKVHVMAELMYATGMRIGEALRLKASAVDFDARTVLVHDTKAGKERIAYLGEYAARVLRLYLSEMKEIVNVNKASDTIFGIKNQATVAAVLSSRMSEICQKHGVGRFTPHNFRHTLGFHLLRRGCDMRYIQLILGHEDMNTTTIYTKVDKGDLRNELDRCHPRNFAATS
jgi:site-specific recombinase XerD